MPTLFNRLYAYYRINNVPIISRDQRTELGVRAMEAFKKSGIEKKYTYTKAQVYDFDGFVVYYPKEFRDTLDALIKDYYDNPPTEPFIFIPPKKLLKKPKEIIQNPTPIPLKKRKVIRKRGELVYSAKNK